MDRITTAFLMAIVATLATAPALARSDQRGIGTHRGFQDFIADGDPVVSVDAGPSLLLGETGDLHDAGFALNIRGDVGLRSLPGVRLQVAIGYWRYRRSDNLKKRSLTMVPLTLSLIGLAPVQRVFGTDRDPVATPYMRFGFGEALSLVGRGNKTRFGEGSIDPFLTWGVGLALSVGTWFGSDWLVARLELTHAILIREESTHVVSASVALGYHASSDSDGDGLLDSHDSCPTKALRRSGSRRSDTARRGQLPRIGRAPAVSSIVASNSSSCSRSAITAQIGAIE